MRRLLILSALLTAGCASIPAVTSTTPTAAEVQRVRSTSVRVMDAIGAAASIANSVGAALNELPVSAALKDSYDCAILRAVGTPTPASSTVVSVCGFTPAETKGAPLAIALTELGAVTTCPSLQTTVARALVALEPLIALIEGSTNATIRIIGVSLRAVTYPLRALLGGTSTCSA